jgi:hypothetical protein
VDRLLARLERRFGRYAPGNLTYALIGAQLVGLLIGLSAPDKVPLLTFEREAILAGEWWRVLSWLAIPPSFSPVWALFSLYWLYAVGTALESEWGAFKFLVYWLVGVVGTIGAAWVADAPATNTIFLMTLFLAFASLWPDYEIRVFFIIPIKVKWLALLDAAYILFFIGQAHGLAVLQPIAGVANYLLFFGGALFDRARGFRRQAAQASARSKLRAMKAGAAMPTNRRCAICGASNQDPEVELRVCDCAKCGGVVRDLCLKHIRDH